MLHSQIMNLYFINHMFRKYFFSIRVIEEWNGLRAALLNCNTAHAVKKNWLSLYFKKRGYIYKQCWASFISSWAELTKGTETKGLFELTVRERSICIVLFAISDTNDCSVTIDLYCYPEIIYKFSITLYKSAISLQQ